MSARWLGVLLFVVVAMASQAHAQGANGRQPTRVGWAFQLDLATGGDDLYNRETHASETNLGQGVTASLGAFFRPNPGSDFQLLGLVGFKSGVGLPASDEEADVTRWVFQLLASYPLENKWYVGGGPVVHTNPKYVDEYPDALDVDFDDAVGATIEGGWS